MYILVNREDYPNARFNDYYTKDYKIKDDRNMTCREIEEELEKLKKYVLSKTKNKEILVANLSQIQNLLGMPENNKTDRLFLPGSKPGTVCGYMLIGVEIK